MENTQKILESMFGKLDNFLKTETVIGEPIVIDDIKIIPIITASFGLGGGFGEDEENAGGGGGGLGCKISPDAVLVIKDGKVEMVPIKKKASLEKLIDKVPEIMTKIEEMKGKEDEKEKKEKKDKE